MQKIPLKKAVPGMILARDVYRNDSPAGMPACGSGVVLTDVLISRFEQINVQALYVEGHPLKEPGAATYEEVAAILDRRFEKVLSDPLGAKLNQIYKDYFKRAMGEEIGDEAK